MRDGVLLVLSTPISPATSSMASCHRYPPGSGLVSPSSSMSSFIWNKSCLVRSGPRRRKHVWIVFIGQSSSGSHTWEQVCVCVFYMLGTLWIPLTCDIQITFYNNLTQKSKKFQKVPILVLAICKFHQQWRQNIRKNILKMVISGLGHPWGITQISLINTMVVVSLVCVF